MTNPRREYHQEWYRKNKAKRAAQMREQNLRARYGITGEQFAQMLAEQNGGCQICGAGEGYGGKRLAVDHCHESGVVRGLLCDRCNLVIGKMNEQLLRRAADYLSSIHSGA